ncbi:MAG TPA: sigma-70 family RNA polymerase sigma factor [Bdellovibrionota bacterium]|nr:sigma-70 family RNA polymerase sigma factor [Bdellovibrionota bacterium]
MKSKSASASGAGPTGPATSAAITAPEGAPPAPSAIDLIIEKYGDLVYDLCESILWGSQGSQVVLRSIFRELKAEHKFNRYAQHERAWVLHVACERLRDVSREHARKITASEQLQLDASAKSADRLKQFDSYFHRLAVNDQMVLLLRDKYGLPYSEIAAILSTPEGSLKIRRQQALRTLEDWIWGE